MRKKGFLYVIILVVGLLAVLCVGCGKKYKRSKEWSDYDINSTAIQMGNSMFYVGMTMEEFLNKLDASGLDHSNYFYVQDGHNYIQGESISNLKVKIDKKGATFYIIKSDADHINTQGNNDNISPYEYGIRIGLTTPKKCNTSLSSCIVDIIEPLGELRNYCQYPLGLSYNEITSMSYKDVLKLGDTMEDYRIIDNSDDTSYKNISFLYEGNSFSYTNQSNSSFVSWIKDYVFLLDENKRVIDINFDMDYCHHPYCVYTKIDDIPEKHLRDWDNLHGYEQFFIGDKDFPEEREQKTIDGERYGTFITYSGKGRINFYIVYRYPDYKIAPENPYTTEFRIISNDFVSNEFEAMNYDMFSPFSQKSVVWYGLNDLEDEFKKRNDEYILDSTIDGFTPGISLSEVDFESFPSYNKE